MFDLLVRMKNGLVMTGMSIRFMFSAPKLLFFPLLRIILFSLIYPALCAALIFSLVKTKGWFAENIGKFVIYVLVIMVLVLFLFLFFMITLFCSIATIDYLFALFQNGRPSIRSSIAVALKRLPIICLWAGMHTGVGFVIRLIGGNEKSSGWRSLLSGTLSLAWDIATYFVPPIIAEKRTSIRETITESSQLMKQRFGEVVGVAVSFNLIASLIFPGILAIAMLIMNYLYDSGEGKKYAIDFYQYPHAYYILAVIFVVTLIIRAFISSAQDIFKAAAFNSVHGKPTGPFSAHFIEKNFEKK